MSSQTAADAQRRELKHYRKSTRGHHIWTAFRREEKKFKSKFPPPPFDEVLDLRSLVEGAVEMESYKSRGRPDCVPVQEFHLKGDSSRRAFGLTDIPGFVMLPKFVPEDDQLILVNSCLSAYTRTNETNLHAHYDIPESGIWALHESRDTSTLIQPKHVTREVSIYADEEKGARRLVDNEAGSLDSVQQGYSTLKLPSPPSTSAVPTVASELLPRLRWANLGYSYHWGTKSYDFSKGTRAIPLEVSSLCKEVVATIDWHNVWLGRDGIDGWEHESRPDWPDWPNDYCPDAGIVNFYQLRDTLMGHVDRSEVSSTTPLVSISLGRSAIFLIGGKSRDDSPIPILLRSGDVVVMSGPFCRRAYHGIPRILENDPSPTYLTRGSSAVASYIMDARINVNVRQVFPKGLHKPLNS